MCFDRHQGELELTIQSTFDNVVLTAPDGKILDYINNKDRGESNMERNNLSKKVIRLFPIIFPFLFATVANILTNALAVSISVLLIASIPLALVFNRSFCGFLCHIGAMQRILRFTGAKLLKRKVKMPFALDRILKKLKYLLLAGIIIWFVAWGGLLPDTAGAERGQVLESIPIVLIWVLLFIILAGSLFFDRFFCKYLCILGGAYGIIGKVSPFAIYRNEELCVNCKLCTKQCPATLEIHRMSRVTSAECMSCQRCISVCPKEKALTNGLRSKEIPFLLYVAAAVLFYLLSIFIVMRFL